MKWKYTNSAEEDGVEASAAALEALLSGAGGMNVGGGGGGGAVRAVENDIYFYGDITESNALDLNSTLHAVDKKLAVSG